MRKGMGGTWSAACFAAFLLLPLWAGRLEPNAYTGGRSQSESARAERNSSAVATMLGEFRTAASDIMFIKTERYLDSGIAYQPHISQARLSTVGQIEEVEEHAEHATGAHDEDAEGHEHHDDHAGHHEHEESAGTPTVIPAPAQDYRGVIGWMHRNIKPWRDPSLPHEHTDGLELLPWFRLMTVSDPHYIRGYAIGGWWLTRRNLDEGIRFAEEGLRNNPASFEIWYTYGNLLLEKARIANAHILVPASSSARPLFFKARDAFRSGAEQALRQRPLDWAPDPEKPSPWTDYMEEDARGCARMDALCERNYGSREDAVQRAVRYVRILGPDEPLDRVIQEANQAAPAAGAGAGP
jgi:hypothetical protein